MKNIQVIDSATNCTYDIFEINDDDFEKIFPRSTDIQFIEDVIERLGKKLSLKILQEMWKKRQDKKKVLGIHGTLFYELRDEKKKFYPTNKEDEMIANPN